MENYTPPYTITENILNLVAKIMESVGKVHSINNLSLLPRLRRVNRVKSIQSSLAIENNTLSLQQVTDVLNGKRVLGPKDDIIAVKNANLAYKELENIDPYSISDLLKTHGIMMQGLVPEAGKIRTSQVGVVNNLGKVVHLAPSHDMVPSLLSDLFNWLKSSETNILIKSCVFHYEFEFIHPFLDGNGRMGRLWQTAILAHWQPIFEWLPVESIIKDNQDEYYRAITLSTSNGESSVFIEFMLGAIYKAMQGLISDTAEHELHITNQINRLMSVLEDYPQSATELMQKLNLKSRNGFRINYLQPAIDAGLVKLTEPDKPTSKNQRYLKK